MPLAVRATGARPTINRSTAILAVVSLSLAAFAITRLMTQPLDSGDEVLGPHQPRPAWGWIGCRLGDLDEQASQPSGIESGGADRGVGGGVLIVDVLPDSPALAGGLRPNDVIRRMDDQPIRSTADLRIVLRETKPGQVMTFTVMREGREQVIPVTLGTRPIVPTPPPPELPN